MAHTPTSVILFRIVLFIIALGLIDLYVFKGIKAALSGIESPAKRKFIYYFYWGISISILLVLIYAALTFNRNTMNISSFWKIMTGVLVLFLVPKILFSVFLLLEDVIRLLRAGGVGVWKLISPQSDVAFFESRRKFVSQIGLGIAAIPFLGILHGITKGKYNFKVHNLTLRFKDLPEAFHGFTIAQISDIHSGSFDSEEGVLKGIELVNAQKADLFVFTGDLVNNHSEEIEPWIDHFKQIKAPYGKFSITGNHDYGDYIDWPTAEAKKENFRKLIEHHKSLEFNLLLNEHRFIEKDGQKLALVGIENWGLPPFPQYGDLNKALNGLPKDAFTILMSHDPSHWTAETLKHEHHVHLTLAGHTHGMQFGVEIPGIKWSPVKYRYNEWAGLYEQQNKYINVNRGFGFIGFPGRVGIWPEVTLITLEKA